MFGSDWEPATATIVAKKFHESGDTTGTWEYVADVTTASGAAFRARLKQPPLMSHVIRLQVGAVISVLADVKQQRAKFDKSDPKVSGADVHRANKDTFDEALHQPPGTPPPGT
jgi:hypothetical protein